MKVIKEPPAERSDGTLHELCGGNRYYLFCPGCHAQLKVDHPDNPKAWENAALHCFSTNVHGFNGDMDRPTLTPSLLCKGQASVCHSFVRDGRIEFLSDCTHPLANQTVDLSDVPQHWIDKFVTTSEG